MWKKPIDAVSKLKHDERALALLALVPNLDGQIKEEMMEKALDMVSEIQDDSDQRKVLSSLLHNLDGQIKEEMMEKILRVVFKIQNDSDRSQALYIMLSYLKNLPITNLYFWWKRTIQILSERTRSSLFVDIITLIPIINDLGNDETLYEIAYAVIDVSRWWP